MNLFKNKFFVSVLILSVTIFLLSAPTAQAGNALGTVLTIVAVVVAVVVTVYCVPCGAAMAELAASIATATAVVTTFIPFSITLTAGTAFWTYTVVTYLTLTGAVLIVGGMAVAAVACAEGLICPGGQSSGLLLTPISSQGIGCTYQIPMTFYNWKEIIYSWVVADFSDEIGRQVAIYRFTLPANSDQATLNTWFVNTIKGNVGNGWRSPIADVGGNLLWDYYHTSTDSAPLITVPYENLCVGNVCKFTDATVPENSYVAYVAKVLGSYSFSYTTSGGDGGGETVTLTKENKFFTNNNIGYVVFPASTIGNAINGPYQTSSCPPPPPPAPCANGATNPPTCSVNAACGSANGVSFDTIPTANLCSLGTASAVSGSGPWSWTCAGTNGGSSASCSAGINTYPLSITPNGQGTVTGNPAGGSFPYGTIVTLTPSASGGNVFTGWSGDCSGTGACAVTVDGAKNVTANFAALPGNFDLSLGGGGGSGAVSCNSVPLSWTASSDATAYRILRGSPKVDISPYQPYTALNHSDTTVSENTDYTYQIEAYNSAGTQRSNSINIATPYCPPTVNLSAFPLSVYQAQAVTLTWTTTYAAFCSASEAWSGSKPANGNEIVHPIVAPITSYAISCSGPGGTAVQSVSINVTPLALPDWREIVPR